jgi:hypothetical protein
MALFVDGPAPTIDDLADQDTGILAVSKTVGININSKLRLSQEEIRTEVELLLIRLQPPGDVPMTPLLSVEQVVVTPTLKRWETMHALELFYRDAYFSDLVDRYQPKWQEYMSLASGARDNFVASGLGLVNDPIHRARLPFLSFVAGPQSGGLLYASVAWVNAAGQEGAASEASSITIPDGNLMTVTATNPPANAVGFQVYAGPTLDAMFRQNNVLLPIGATYTYVPGQVTQGPLPGRGQAPDSVKPLARTLLRG